MGCHCLLWRKASEGQTALCFSVGLGSITAWGFCKEHILKDSDSDLTCRLSPPRAVSVVVLMSRDPARVWLRWSSRRHWLGWPGLAPVFPHMSPRLLGGPGDGPGGCRPFPVGGVTMTTQEALEAGSLLILSLDPSRAAPQSFLWREIGSFVKCVSHCSQATSTQVNNLAFCIGLDEESHTVCLILSLYTLEHQLL